MQSEKSPTAARAHGHKIKDDNCTFYSICLTYKFVKEFLFKQDINQLTHRSWYLIFHVLCSAHDSNVQEESQVEIDWDLHVWGPQEAHGDFGLSLSHWPGRRLEQEDWFS